jgi:ABC-type multidrug transport system fused ATPase/permease subunit
MTETNSGKLISLISADLFTVERGLSFFPILIAGPFINFVAYYFLAKEVGATYTIVIFCLWLFLMLIQYIVTTYSKKLKARESGMNDNRLKLINDLVVGSRTIKCYGWEKHYIEKIR